MLLLSSLVCAVWDMSLLIIFLFGAGLGGVLLALNLVLHEKKSGISGRNIRQVS
jgi:hypothetical protein